MSMDIKYTDLVGKIAEFEVLTAKAHLMFEAQTGLKLDKMTDFLLKFIFLEDYHDRPVTMTIITNTLVTNENTIRTKLKSLIEHELIEIVKCKDDSRSRRIKPTKLCQRLLLIDATSKLKTMEALAPIFKEAFGHILEDLYKKHSVEPYKSFTEIEEYASYKAKYLSAKNRYKNTLKNLG
jgi:DNA-binding MarR family transcriptional regulator|tara:strand:- start:881 stop:1420 length:540 start_codon:yes stop_codon:yes gene_type:complete